ncbi:conserved hypothetical protein [Candida albicans WO-1]|uniref:Uncharacterized protein n=1 Tax=Candida albicans (strain WO-1) TaxID=294748 RepID=C4YPD7_CANAW|nr:conserved hypothetical protein [Candida albicans WO-1]
MDISNHQPNVSQTVPFLFNVLQVILNVFWEFVRVPFIQRVDVLGVWQLQVWMGQDKFTQSSIQSEKIDTVTCSQCQMGRCTVHGVPRSDHLLTRTQDIADATSRPLLQLVHTKNRTNRNTSIDIGRPINWISTNSICATTWEHNKVFLLFRNQNLDVVGRSHGIDKDLITNHIQFLSNITGRVGRARNTNKVDQLSSSDIVGNKLECKLKRIQQQRQLTGGGGSNSLSFL